ncbi:hypothetical protein [Streptomyces sp. NPDC050504]|uniref:hypothetical protein n=1 Tax=Streptomyces sp. NPDC050504 TaxID=3365618 RepID=UPI00379E0AA3
MTVHRQWIEGATIHGSVVQAQEIHHLHLAERRPLYGVEAFPAERPAIPAAYVREQPARLLDARYALVDFTGRREELSRLTGWRDELDRVSVLLLHGPGGQGKSRLAAQFARLSGAAGWSVLQARHASDAVPFPVRPETEPATGTPGVLMVADYAERWPTDDLMELLLDAVRQGGRIRVLLVARPRGTWWQHLVKRLGDFDIPVLDLPLPGLSDDADATPDALFRTARDCFAATLDVADVAAVTPPDRLADDPEYRQVLAVHMAALAAVDAHRRGTPVPEGAAAVSAYLLSRERAHWETLHRNGRVRITPGAFGQAVYAAALTGALGHSEAVRALTRIGVGTTEHTDQVLKDHALSYPSPGGATVLEPLYPDRLAEDFLALSAAGHGTDGFEPDPWSLDAPGRLLDGTPLSCERRVMATLVAAAARWPHVRESQLEVLLSGQPRLGVAAGGATLAALSEMDGIDPAVLEAVEAYLPPGRHADLAPGAAALAQRLIGHRLQRTPDLAGQARLLNDLAQRQYHAGLTEEALRSGQRAVAIGQGTAVDPGAVREPSFAAVMADVGVYHAKQDEPAEALAATGQAVHLLRGLALAHPHRYDDSLALALSNYAADLAATGQWRSALVTAREAADRARGLARGPVGDPAGTAHWATLAAALANLAICLAHEGSRVAACDAAEEAVEIQRGLAAVDPHAFEPTLARALLNLSSRTAHVSRHEESGTAAGEAVELLRRLVGINPAGYQEELAVALSQHAERLLTLGRRTEACHALTESVTVRRRTAADDPAHQPGLIASLEKLGLELTRTNEHGRAGPVWDEALELRRGRAERGGEPEIVPLAGLLNTIAWLGFAQRRDLPGSLAAAREATGLLWRFVGLQGELPPGLAESVDIQARVLAALERTDEAVEVLRRLAKLRTEQLAPVLPPGPPGEQEGTLAR